MKQMTKEQAIKFHDLELWKDMTDSQIAELQLLQDRLLVPFTVFHKAIETSLNRPVFTHEFGLNREGLLKELLGESKTPTLEEIIGLLPKEKTIVVFT